MRMALVLSLPTALGGCGVNTIPTLEANAKTKFADLQADYQRRADLIPNLVATVKGYAAQEKSVLVEVTQARASATQIHIDPQTATTDPAAMQKYAAAQNSLGGALSRLLVASERYPELKSNENFLALQSQLEGTENRITIARRDYNSAVQDYNLSLVTFPSILWAKSIYSAEKPMTQFQASDAAQNAPTVSFDSAAPPAAPAANTSGR
jgi:LemA protein